MGMTQAPSFRFAELESVLNNVELVQVTRLAGMSFARHLPATSHLTHSHLTENLKILVRHVGSSELGGLG